MASPRMVELLRSVYGAGTIRSLDPFLSEVAPGLTHMLTRYQGGPGPILDRRQIVLRDSGSQVGTICQFTVSALADGRFIATLTEARDEANGRLSDAGTAAATDPLSGLANRESFSALARQHLAVYRGRSFSVLMVDIDHFASVNQRYGQECGDMILRGVGQNLIGVVRGQDVVARNHGAGFVALLADIEAAAVRQIGERLRKMVLNMPFFAEDGTAIPITVSIGIDVAAVTDRVGEGDLDVSMTAAAARLYLAKEAGRNRVSAPEADPAERPRAIA